jgi:hypothetical protein
MSHLSPGAADRFWRRARAGTPALLVLVLVLAVGLRFHLLGEQSLWHDEGNSYVQSLPATSTRRGITGCWRAGAC